MSRIPIRTPSRTRQANVQDRAEEAEKENANTASVHQGIFAKPLLTTGQSVPSTRTESPVKLIQIPQAKTKLVPQAALNKVTSSNTTSGNNANAGHRRVITADTQMTPPRTHVKNAAQAKSSTALKEHIAKARLEMQRSAKKTLDTAKVVTLNSGTIHNEELFTETSLDTDDPFSAIKDPFNQARHKPISDERIDRAIAVARSQGKLSIACMQLSCIPQSVCDMYKPDPSHVIDFSQEQSASWYEYADLTSFNAVDNEITSLDEAFIELGGGLTSIDMHNNRLDHVPSSLLDLSQLSTLNLSRNRLDSSVLDVISRISSLTILHLAGNHLSGALPSCLGNLSRLQELDLSENSLSSIGDSLIGCHDLLKLNLSNNKLRYFSASQVRTQARLEECNVSHNEIESPFVDCSITFPRLSLLNLTKNKLKSLSSNSYALHLPSLISLALAQNQLKDLDGLMSYDALLILDINGNRFCEISDTVFSHMQNLKNLDISDNNFDEIPTKIGHLRGLSQFRWQGNPARMRGCYDMGVTQILQFLQSREIALDAA